MSGYEYKTVALSRTVSGRRRRRQSEADLVAEQLGRALNDEAVDGWEYLRAETLTTPGRSGMFQKASPAAYVVLIFRRAKALDWNRPGQADTAAQQAQPHQTADVRHATPPPSAAAPAIAPAPSPATEAPRPSPTGPDLRIASTSGQLVSRTEPIVPDNPAMHPNAPRAPLGPATD